MWYAITFLIYFDISFDFEMKRKKTFLFQVEKKGEKKFDLRPPGIEPGVGRANHSAIYACGIDT